MGHGKADCRTKDANCRTCGKNGHLPNVCRSSGGSGKGKGIGKDKNFSQSLYHRGKGKSEKARLRCGRNGRAKFNCGNKDE